MVQEQLDRLEFHQQPTILKALIHKIKISRNESVFPFTDQKFPPKEDIVIPVITSYHPAAHQIIKTKRKRLQDITETILQEVQSTTIKRVKYVIAYRISNRLSKHIEKLQHPKEETTEMIKTIINNNGNGLQDLKP